MCWFASLFQTNKKKKDELNLVKHFQKIKRSCVQHENKGEFIHQSFLTVSNKNGLYCLFIGLRKKITNMCFLMS